MHVHRVVTAANLCGGARAREALRDTLSALGRTGYPLSMSATQFGSMKSKDLIALLKRQPLGYEVTHQTGSHRKLKSDDYPPLLFAFHDRDTVPPGLVRKILTKDVGLSKQEALDLL
jgi:predicted RNA binding protein YcfA (HicA-like mRNA interferase family)